MSLHLNLLVIFFLGRVSLWTTAKDVNPPKTARREGSWLGKRVGEGRERLLKIVGQEKFHQIISRTFSSPFSQIAGLF